METIEIKAATVEEAIEKGLEKLNKKREEVEIEIADAGGFLKKAKVLLTVKATEGEKAEAFLKQLLQKMNLNINAELTEDAEKALIQLSGADSGKIIGYRGDVLDAVQYITSVAVNAEQENFKKIIIDCENYRTKREETLTSLAGKLAEKAVFKGRKVALEPMNPFERRIIHSALQNNENVTTESEGIEPNRHVVIVPKNLKPFSYEGRDKFEGRNRYEGRDRRQGSPDGRGMRDRANGRDRTDRGARPDRGERQDRPRGGFGNKPSSKSTFNGFGTYLGNSKSGFGADNSFVKKSGFDNLKD